MELPASFWSRISPEPTTGCWLWLGYGRRYPRIKGKGLPTNRAHRLAFIALVGSVSDDEHVHHACENKWCVNPDHLEKIGAVEHGSLHAPRQSRCVHGHDRTDQENLYVYRLPNGAEKRLCKPCVLDRQRV